MNKKAQQKIISKQRIINVAARLFKKNGYAATGIDEIMQEAGLTAGAFYAHFKSKKHLLELTVEHSLIKSREQLLKGTERLSGDFKNQIIMNKYISFLHRDLIENGCVIPSLGAEIQRASKKNSKVLEKYLSDWVSLLVENMEFNLDDLAKRKKAMSWISQAVGAVMLSRMTKDLKLSDEIINLNQLD